MNEYKSGFEYCVFWDGVHYFDSFEAATKYAATAARLNGYHISTHVYKLVGIVELESPPMKVTKIG